MARGIDTAAHEGSLATGTCAVVAGGIDIIYPPENASLYARIKQDGVIVAEMPFGQIPQARHFPRRNRIISGLSRGVVVVEAAEGSGSLITANFALEQGREVFAVPGSPLDPRAKGTNRLIRDGAVLTETADDVIAVLNAQRTGFREPGGAHVRCAVSATEDVDSIRTRGSRNSWVQLPLKSTNSFARSGPRRRWSWPRFWSLNWLAGWSGIGAEKSPGPDTLATNRADGTSTCKLLFTSSAPNTPPCG